MSQFTVPEIAAKIGCDRRHVLRMAQNGLIPGAFREGRGWWRVPDSANLQGWISAELMKVLSRDSLGRDRRIHLTQAVDRIVRVLGATKIRMRKTGQELSETEIASLSHLLEKLSFFLDVRIELKPIYEPAEPAENLSEQATE